jgi:ribulose-5-phosphate 4-epimerase/fuculose-1-phosphate aldolase
MATKREVKELKDKVARGTRILFHEDLADFHGHLSARIPGTRDLLIKPVLVSLRDIRARDILRINIDEYKARIAENERKISGTAKAIREPALPPRETIIHCAVYEARPDVNSVIHTHQLYATAFGAAGTPIKPIHVTSAAFGRGTPILDKPDLIVSEADGRIIAKALGKHNALLLRNHGVVTVGTSVEHAVCNAVYLERSAKMQLIATMVGKPTFLSTAFCLAFGENMKKRASHAFEYLESLAEDGER